MFVLDPRLQQDTWVLGDFALCQLLLSRDANYPWFILVPRRAEALKRSYGADKMNVATLGNVVSQMHMHVIVRQHDDVAWPAPVWGKCPAVAYTDAQVQAVRARVRNLHLEGFQEAAHVA